MIHEDNGYRYSIEDGRWVDDPPVIPDRARDIRASARVIVLIVVIVALTWATHRYMIGHAGW